MSYYSWNFVAPQKLDVALSLPQVVKCYNYKACNDSDKTEFLSTYSSFVH